MSFYKSLECEEDLLVSFSPSSFRFHFSPSFFFCVFAIVLAQRMRPHHMKCRCYLTKPSVFATTNYPQQPQVRQRSRYDTCQGIHAQILSSGSRRYIIMRSILFHFFFLSTFLPSLLLSLSIFSPLVNIQISFTSNCSFLSLLSPLH